MTIDHVKKIFYEYFDRLKINGFFIIDDISHLPYTKTNIRDNFYCEINNKETFDKILEIYNNNQDNFDLEFSFISSGLAIITKKQDNINKIKPIILRENRIKNIFKKNMEKNKKKLIVFIPSIEDGGVEKNLYLILNYISKKIGLIDLITFDNKNYHKFNKKINIINPLLNFSFFLVENLNIYFA